MPAARCLEPDGLPPAIAQTIVKAQTGWLSNEEILHLLKSVASFGLPVSTEAPVRPAGGSLYVFDKKACRYFRKDGHPWETKGDGKTVNETHEKLKVDNVKTLNCYYARSGVDDLKRRSYWRLDVPGGEPVYALVHYLNAEGKAGTGPQRYRWDHVDEEDVGPRRGRPRHGAYAGGGGRLDAAALAALTREHVAREQAEAGQGHMLDRFKLYMSQREVQLQGLGAGPAGGGYEASHASSLAEGQSGALSQLTQLLSANPSGLSNPSGLASVLAAPCGSQLPTPSPSGQPSWLAQLSSAQQAALLQSQLGSVAGASLLAGQLTGLLAGSASENLFGSLPPGYNPATAAALGSLQQQLDAQPSQVDMLLEQARLEQARAEALQRPQPGPLFLSGQLVAQHLAAQQAQQAQQAQLTAAQDLVRQQQLRQAEAQLAVLAEQYQLRAAMVAHLQAQEQAVQAQSQAMQAQAAAHAQAELQAATVAAAEAAQQHQHQQQQQQNLQQQATAAAKQAAAAPSTGQDMPPPPPHQPQQPGPGLISQQFHVLAPLQPNPNPLVQPRAGGSLGAGAGPFGRLPLKKEVSFDDECTRALFNQISLGIKDGSDVAAHLAQLLGSADGAEGAAAAAAAPPVAALLASPPRHRRNLSSTSSGIPRFTSFDAAQDVGGLLAAQLDTDINNLPTAGGELAPVDEAEGDAAGGSIDVGLLFSSSRSGATTLGLSSSSGMAAAPAPAASPPAATSATVHHTLEPSPLLQTSVSPSSAPAAGADAPAGATAAAPEASPTPSRSLTFAPLPSLDSRRLGSITSLLGASSLNGLLGAHSSDSGSAGAPNSGGSAASGGKGIDRQGSGVSSGGGLALHCDGSGSASGSAAGSTLLPRPARGALGHLGGALAAGARRTQAKEERVGAAAQAWQGARNQRLAQAREHRLAAPEDAGAAQEACMLVDNPLARLQSYNRALQSGTPATPVVQAPARVVEQQEAARQEEAARGLFKNMSIEERALLKNMSVEEQEVICLLSSASQAARATQSPTTSPGEKHSQEQPQAS